MRPATPRTAWVFRLVPLGCAACVAGCVLVGPNYVAPTASELNVPPSWQGASSTTGTGLEVADWWQHLGDALLTRIITQAMQASPDVQSARAKLRQARAQRRLAFGNLWPTINASSSAQHTEISQSGVEGAQNPGPNGGGGGGFQDLYDVGFDASWEPDIVGGQRRALEAARADAAASMASLHECAGDVGGRGRTQLCRGAVVASTDRHRSSKPWQPIRDLGAHPVACAGRLDQFAGRRAATHQRGADAGGDSCPRNLLG